MEPAQVEAWKPVTDAVHYTAGEKGYIDYPKWT
jgi:hypothetical protein